MNEFKRRWKGFTREEVSERMRALAYKKNKGMKKEERKEHARMMVNARNKQKGNSGSRARVESGGAH